MLPMTPIPVIIKGSQQIEDHKFFIIKTLFASFEGTRGDGFGKNNKQMEEIKYIGRRGLSRVNFSS